MLESGAAAGVQRAVAEFRHDRQNGELLRMGELAEASGVPVPTIKHYLREGLCRSRSRPAATWPTTRPSSSTGSG